MEENIKKIKSFLQQGNLEEADKVCDSALAAEANNAELYYLKALIMWQKSEVFNIDREKFPALLKKATDLNPHYAEPYKLWAYANMLLGYPNLAEDGYSLAIKAQPADLEAYGQRGEARCKLNKFQEAIEDFNKVLEIDPNNSRAYAMRAQAKKALKDWTGAAEDYSKAIEYNPNYGGGFFGRGTSKVQLGDFAGALEDFTHFLELYPDSVPEAYGHRGDVKIHLNDLPGALEDFQKALELDPNNEDARRAVNDLQGAILQSLPKDATMLQVTLKNGRRVRQVIINGKIVNLWPLNEKTDGELSD